MFLTPTALTAGPERPVAEERSCELGGYDHGLQGVDGHDRIAAPILHGLADLVQYVCVGSELGPYGDAHGILYGGHYLLDEGGVGTDLHPVSLGVGAREVEFHGAGAVVLHPSRQFRELRGVGPVYGSDDLPVGDRLLHLLPEKFYPGVGEAHGVDETSLDLGEARVLVPGFGDEADGFRHHGPCSGLEHPDHRCTGLIHDAGCDHPRKF